MTEPLEPWIVAQLREIGLSDPTPDEPLHVRLVNTLRNVRGQSLGARLVALQFDFNWELRDAGRAYAEAKVAYEHHIDRRTIELRAEGAKSRAEAEQVARAEDEAHGLHLAYLLAEQRERAMRKFLDTISNAFDNFRTEQANQRAGDRFGASGHTGHA